MIRHDILIVLFYLCLTASVSAFSVGPAARVMTAANADVAAHHRVMTRLFAEEEQENADGEDKKVDEDHILPAESDTDILNSPAFLARKIDVLKSDIEKAEDELDELQELVAAGKAEWGDQLDDLQVEVCCKRDV